MNHAINMFPKTREEIQRQCYAMMAVCLRNALPLVHKCIEESPGFNNDLEDLESGMRTVLELQRTWSHPESKFIEDVYNEKYQGRFHLSFGQPWELEKPEAGSC
jgi:hypothetical protein